MYMVCEIQRRVKDALRQFLRDSCRGTYDETPSHATSGGAGHVVDTSCNWKHGHQNAHAVTNGLPV